MLAMLLLGSLSMKAQLFSEDFQNGMPANFTLINVDGRTPNAAVAYINNAWIVEDNGIIGGPAGDSVAMSTSWYTPAGASDDWMITSAITLPATPAQVLRWRARAQDPDFPDGYEVRISTTGVTVADFAAAPIYATTAESGTWIARQADLSAYAGQTIYVAFRNNANDQFILLIDDIEVADAAAFYDVSLADAPFLGGEYDQVPATQVAPLSFGATVVNTGFDPVTNVAVSMEVFDFAGTSLFTAPMTSTATNLAVGDTAIFTTTGTYTPPAVADLYFAEYIVSITEADGDAANDTFFTTVFVTDSTYARDVNTLNGVVSLGTDAGGGVNIFGQNYDLPTGGAITGVSAYFNTPAAGDSVSASLYTVDAATGAPQTLVTSSPVHVFTAADAGTFVRFAFDTQVPFPANTQFFVGVNEYAPGNLTLGVSNDIFTPEASWVKSDSFGGGVWIPNDNFWVGEFSYLVRPIMNFCSSLDALAATAQDNGGDSGSAWVAASGGVPPYTYSWSNGGVTDTVLFLTAGTYSVTITDGQGCETMVDNIVVQDNTSIEEELEAGINLLEAFPNPSAGIFTVNLELAKTDDLKLEVYDLSGRMLFADQASRVSEYRKEINLSAQSAGMYLLRVQTSEGVAHRRLIVE